MDEEQGQAYGAFLSQRRAELVERIASAARRASRDPRDVTLAAVSKTVDVDGVVAAWHAGYRVFAENRPQELTRKLAGLAAHPEVSPVRFDLIGNLQTNKVNQVLAAAPALIHSISSLHLAAAVSKRADARGLCVPILLEVNVSGEATKSGFTPQGMREALDELLGLPGIRVEGLMTMAPAADATASRHSFCGLRELRDELAPATDSGLPTLSCGMSGDFEIAVEEGSTLVRLGRIVFSPEYLLG